MFVSHKVPCILWGCSIDPHRIDKHLIEYLNKYQLITVRESITYKALKGNGIKNLYLIPDTAFKLKKIERELPKGFSPTNTVGINLSPLISGYESNKGIKFANYEHLIAFMLTAYGS